MPDGRENSGILTADGRPGSSAPAVTTPTYVSAPQVLSRDPSDPVRRDADSLVERLIHHFRATTTDQVDNPWHEPVSNYLDEQRFRDEIETIHRKVPLPLALSCELATPGSYKALEVAGTPVIITRGADGDVHAMVNACRHRGGQIVPEGTGTTRRLTCPYHAWSYDLAGCLVGIYGEKTFGPVDKDARSLLSLPAAERAGIVFVSLDRFSPLDIDAWLGDLLPLLEGLNLAHGYKHSSKELAGPNWKVTLDGYLESYHFASLHRTTVFKTNYSNMAAFDSWGPHERIAFALRTIGEESQRPLDVRDPAACVGPIYLLFPGMAIAGGWRDSAAVSIVLPGRTVGESWTQQIIVLREPPASDEVAKAADVTRDWFYSVVLEEDYATGFGVQRGLAALAGTDYVFGRNEPGVQHFHRVIDSRLATLPQRD